MEKQTGPNVHKKITHHLAGLGILTGLAISATCAPYIADNMNMGIVVNLSNRTDVQPRNDRTLSLMTWNIHGGETTDGRSNLFTVIAFIAKRDDALVCLQEVPEKLVQDNVKLSKYTKIFSPTYRNLWTGETRGNAILTDLTLKSASQVHLTHTIRRPNRSAMNVIFSKSIGNHDQELSVVNTHLESHIPDMRNLQGTQVGTFALKTQSDIICGDFNETSNRPVHYLLATMNYKNTECTQDIAEPAIDGVLINNNSELKEVSCQFLPQPVAHTSDHNPLIIKISLK